MHCEYVLAFAFAGTYASIFAITYALGLACNTNNFERLVKWS